MCDDCHGHGHGHGRQGHGLADRQESHGDRKEGRGPGHDGGGWEAVRPRRADARVVVVGKGGVGKTTVTALLARLLARQGCPVVAVDGDEQSNLGATLGFGSEALRSLMAVAEDVEYVEQRTGARPGAGGGLLRLNPDASDAVERLARGGPDGVRLLVMGGLQRAGGGCLCPETAMLAATLRAMEGRRGEVVLLDTHAGVEHFGRALARGFDQAVVVVDATANAVAVGLECARLADALGIGVRHLVVNRLRRPGDLERVMARVGDQGWRFASVHGLPFEEAALDTDGGVGPLLEGGALANALAWLADELAPADGRVRVPVGGP